MTYLIPSNLPLAPDTRKRPPQSGFVQTGFEDQKPILAGMSARACRSIPSHAL